MFATHELVRDLQGVLPAPADHRVVTLSDLGDGPPQRDALYDLMATCFVDDPTSGGERVSRARFDAHVLGHPTFSPAGTLLTLDGERQVGLALVGLLDEHEAWLAFLGVRASHRRYGLGRSLLVSAVRWAADRGASQLVMRVHTGNQAMQRLASSVGFCGTFGTGGSR